MKKPKSVSREGVVLSKEGSIKLMTEERINWYLREMDNPAFWNRFAPEERAALKEKLTLSLNFYKIPVPHGLK